jgi:hypothetical protein
MWNNEPIYSRLRSYHSDSDLEGVGSPSPPQPPVSPYGDQDDDEIYSEINSGDTAFLLPQQSSTPNGWCFLLRTTSQVFIYQMTQ